MTTIKAGDLIRTPRFLTVKIVKVFDNDREARQEGYTEPTHYDDAEYDIFGKHIELNRMTFAAVKK
jgi:hypothetical protein